jgi:hypothetical protein
MVDIASRCHFDCFGGGEMNRQFTVVEIEVEAEDGASIVEPED